MQPDELRSARREMGWTQAQMAEALGLSSNFVAMMERGEKAIERRTELAVRYVQMAKLLDGYETGRISSTDEDERGELTVDTSAEAIARLRFKLTLLEQAKE